MSHLKSSATTRCRDTAMQRDTRARSTLETRICERDTHTLDSLDTAERPPASFLRFVSKLWKVFAEINSEFENK